MFGLDFRDKQFPRLGTTYLLRKWLTSRSDTIFWGVNQRHLRFWSPTGRINSCFAACLEIYKICALMYRFTLKDHNIDSLSTEMVTHLGQHEAKIKFRRRFFRFFRIKFRNILWICPYCDILKSCIFHLSYSLKADTFSTYRFVLFWYFDFLKILIWRRKQ